MGPDATGASRAVNAAQRAAIQNGESGMTNQETTCAVVHVRAACRGQRTARLPGTTAHQARRMPSSCCICNTKLVRGFFGIPSAGRIECWCGPRRATRRRLVLHPAATRSSLRPFRSLRCSVPAPFPSPLSTRKTEHRRDRKGRRERMLGRAAPPAPRPLSLLGPRPHAFQSPSRGQSILTPGTAPDTTLILPCHARFASLSPIWNGQAW